MINYREEEKRILDEILGKGVYDNRIRPSGTNGTGNFTINILESADPWILEDMTEHFLGLQLVNVVFPPPSVNATC